MKKIVASSPTRIDFAGGTLDIWPLNLLIDKALTVNVAIALKATCQIEDLPDAGRVPGRTVIRSEDQGVDETWEEASAPPADTRLPLIAECVRWLRPERGFLLTTRCASPAGAGLGGSSSLAISILGGLETFLGRPLTPPRDLITVARDIEARVLQIPTGTQDHFAAMFGGAAAVHLQPGPPTRESLPMDLGRLAGRFVMVYTGGSRLSADANWDMVRRAVDGDAATRRGLGDIGAIAVEMRSAFLAGDFDAIGKLIGREWDARRTLSAKVETDLIAETIRRAREAGAAAGKVCGAGGGGCVLIWCPEERRDEVVHAMEGLASRGLRVLDAGPTPLGLQVG